MAVAAATRPEIIQGGMGVAISGWRLARAVCQAGQLGVVSGTALDVLCTRRLADGDPGGHVREALAAFPVPEVGRWIVEAYFVEGGIAADAAYRQVPRHTLTPSRRLVELTAAANFVEVYLAKQGHQGPVGINYLRKIELPLPASLYGAMLAGVDDVLVGAGNPAEIPALVRALAEHRPVTVPVRVQGARSDDRLGDLHFDPATVVPPSLLAEGVVPTPLRPPRVLAIVASTDLARALAEDPNTRPDGFVVEGPAAGGHNAPPRGPRRVDDLGQPIYDERDEVDLPGLLALGLPVWLAGGYGSPQRLREARSLGASGIQVGTAFAYCAESGFDPTIKAKVHAAVTGPGLPVRADWRCSPTGFPFHVAEVPGSLTDPEVLQARRPVCDLGALRSPYRTPEGTVDYRCPAEPEQAYLRKGGRQANRQGRVCLCNALFASAGFAQRRPHGGVEPPLVTSGADTELVRLLLERHGSQGYSARDVVDYLLGEG